MIEAIVDLFVERAPSAHPRPVLLPTKSLLVVDACANSRSVADLILLVESMAPVRACYAALGLVDALDETADFDLIWLFLDEASDAAYCGLFGRELAERFRRSRVQLIGVGDFDGADCAISLTGSMVGGAPPWRRRRELAHGAELLVEQLLRGSGESS